MSTATYDDVNLILRLYEMRREDKMRAARAWYAANFKPKTMEEFQTLIAPGTEANAYYRMVTSYWEMVASFITSGVLNKELFFQSGLELLFCWERVRELVPEIRQLFGNKAMWKNLESVAKDLIRHLEAQSPGSYEAFSKRVRG